MRRFGLIGKSLKHSFSKNYFTRKFMAEGLADCSYENYELPEIGALNRILQQPGLEGLNVTIPYKEQILSFLHRQEAAVTEIGACNCIRIRDQRLHGFNTDAPAFMNSLLPLLQSHHYQALVLGTGGASKAVCYGLRKLGLSYTIVSRAPQEDQISYQQLDRNLVRSHAVIINTTPAGTYPDVEAAPPVPFEYFTPAHLVYDLIYNPEKTKLLQEAEARGATVLNGMKMLVLQAEESWRIWNESSL